MKNEYNKLTEEKRREEKRREEKRREEKRREYGICIIGCMDNTIDNTFESANRVYDNTGIAPTVNTCGGGGLQPKIVEVKKLNDDIKPILLGGVGEENEFGKQYRQGNRVYDSDGIADLDYPSSETRRGRVINKGQISPTLTTENIPSVIEFGNPDFYNFLYEIDGVLYLIRIRKLIPKECWKLMDFSDEDFEKAESVNSNTQLYKQAGNSIVKNVLVAIMGQLFEGKEEIYKRVNNSTKYIDFTQF